jgi:formiminoglutamase
MSTPSWLTVTSRDAPLVLSLPHTGTTIPDTLSDRLRSRWLALKDSDWWVDRLYAFADDLGATSVRTDVSRTVIDVNRDPSGTSLYPGQATTGLCPIETFDGEPLYAAGAAPDDAEIAHRRTTYFDPYHAALAREIDRLRATHRVVVVYDCHSIRSAVPRLFDGELPHFNVGTNDGASCDPALTRAVEAPCAATGLARVTNGRFKGGYITRHYARPDEGVHAVQMELACRGYLPEPVGPVDETNWPVPFDPGFAETMTATLGAVLEACLVFAASGAASHRGDRP